MSNYKQNALALANPYSFKMPRFGKRSAHLKQMLGNLNQEQDADVIGQTESNASKSVLKLAEFIGEGTLTVDHKQQDVTGIFQL